MLRGGFGVPWQISVAVGSYDMKPMDNYGGVFSIIACPLLGPFSMSGVLGSGDLCSVDWAPSQKHDEPVGLQRAAAM